MKNIIRENKAYLVFLSIAFMFILALDLTKIDENRKQRNETHPNPEWMYYKESFHDLFYLSAPKNWRLYNINNQINDTLFWGAFVKHTGSDDSSPDPDYIFVNILIRNEVGGEDLSTKYHLTRSGKIIKEYYFKESGKIFVLRAVANTNRESEKLIPTFDEIAKSFRIM